MQSTVNRIADRPTSLDATVLAECQRWIDHRLGLHFPPPNWHDLDRHLALLAVELGYEDTRHLVRDLLSSPGDSRLENRLADALTVGETYFFRDPACFEQLKDQVLQPLIDRRKSAGAKYLSLWSAGCATGEEAYSLAMLVDDLLDDADSWQINILGTDLSRQSLKKAQEGVYGAWSFRSAASDLTSRYFQPEPAGVVAAKSAEARFWRIRRNIGNRIRFFELNLAAAFYPDATRGLANIDVIMCRNVLMYFSPAQAIAVLGRLIQCLSDEGILLVGAVDGGYSQAAGLKTQSWPGALAISAQSPSSGVDPETANALDSESTESVLAVGGGAPSPEPLELAQLTPFQSGRLGNTQPGSQTGRSVDENGWARASQALAEGNYSEALSLTGRYLKQGGLTRRQEAEGASLYARILANLRQLDEAEYWARQAIQLDRLQASSYWVLATILLERNRLEGARDELAKALYLQPDFVLAHYLSGLIFKRLQDHRGARRNLRNCLDLLTHMAQGEPVMEGEGMSVSDLSQLATTVLAELENEGVDRELGTVKGTVL
ncbi:CheR family methyltransferase [Marinobacter sp. SS21]|uniref:CheR family methyltransferase n=1 Tax=Marinobacter sp. SS21 TaxID=2979460 RepID=UPI00232D5CBA|nr:CheR family methyltransferase [Marinobacter sp. SS21]MDC0663415.1 hypothetical protein [Marinobacter sp. SS21]